VQIAIADNLDPLKTWELPVSFLCLDCGSGPKASESSVFSLEEPPDPEEESPSAVIAHRTCDFDRPEYCSYDNSNRAIHGEIWRLGTNG
jgi:hypothetical protein